VITGYTSRPKKTSEEPYLFPLRGEIFSIGAALSVSADVAGDLPAVRILAVAELILAGRRKA